MTALDALLSAQGKIEGFNADELIPFAGGAMSADALKGAIRDALAPPGPTGNPEAIEAKAKAYQAAASRCAQVENDLNRVAREKLPAAWRGAVAETASEAVSALGAEVKSTQQVLEQAAKALGQWAADLKWAQSHDESGKAQLHSALDALNHESFLTTAAGGSSSAKNTAANGVNARVSAAQYAQDQAQGINSTLEQLTSEARAELITSPDVDALTSVELATQQSVNGSLLTDTQLERASSALDTMSKADQNAFEKLLSGVRSPLEASYLWQALGAGNSLAAVEKFDAAIQPHGGDQAWLAAHLTPDLTTGQYQGYSFSQGSHDDCVSASTVMAQADADPVLMLSLTTGGTAQGNDSGSAFESRLQKMYLSQYVEGQKADGDSNPGPNSTAGIGSSGENKLANQDLGTVTGSGYHYESLGNSSDRSGVINQINQAVDSGKPVPVDVSNSSEAHQMMIIGREGDKLKIYNPWGFSGWVTDQQFINGQLGSLTSPAHGGPTGGIPTPFAVELPQ